MGMNWPNQSGGGGTAHPERNGVRTEFFHNRKMNRTKTAKKVYSAPQLTLNRCCLSAATCVTLLS
jgi:hypothetical protein